MIDKLHDLYNNTKEFVILYRIIRYSINEFFYNKGLISPDTDFVISRVDCSQYIALSLFAENLLTYNKYH